MKGEKIEVDEDLKKVKQGDSHVYGSLEKGLQTE